MFRCAVESLKRTYDMQSSPNAFAAIRNSNQCPFNGCADPIDAGRSAKRARLSEDAVAAIETQCAQSETSLDVDHMILDYVAYQTTNACFASRKVGQQSDSSKSLASNLAISDSFVSIFKARHPTYKPDPELRLRILLLKCTTLFTQRLTSNPTVPAQSSLVNLRRANQERARAWFDSNDRLPSSSFDPTPFDRDLPTSQQQLERNRAHVLRGLEIPAEDEDYEDAYYGTSSCLSLLDILPFFMQVSAARNAMNDSNLTDRWMQLACSFMLQACLEKYLVFGAKGVYAIDEAFSWGYKEHEHDEIDVDVGHGMTSGIDSEVNAMFEDEEYATQVEGWDDIKAAYITLLFSPRSENGSSSQNLPSTSAEGAKRMEPISHLETVAAKYPIASFEASLLKFLEALSNSISEPVLAQLENGKLHGMTEQQTQKFLLDCGVDTGNFFEVPVGFKVM